MLAWDHRGQLPPAEHFNMGLAAERDYRDAGTGSPCVRAQSREEYSARLCKSRLHRAGKGIEIFKMQIEDGKGVWSDVRGSGGVVLTFETEEEARARLAALYPVIVQMEKYGSGKRTRVVKVFRNDREWEDGTPPG